MVKCIPVHVQNFRNKAKAQSTAQYFYVTGHGRNDSLSYEPPVATVTCKLIIKVHKFFSSNLPTDT